LDIFQGLDLPQANTVDHNSVMHRANVLEKVPRWKTGKETWLEGDAFFWMELTKAGYMFYPVPADDALDVHFVHNKSVQYLLVNKGILYEG